MLQFTFLQYNAIDKGVILFWILRAPLSHSWHYIYLLGIIDLFLTCNYLDTFCTVYTRQSVVADLLIDCCTPELWLICLRLIAN